MKFQYVGNGEEPPKKIVFMNKVSFTLNHKAVEVTDERIIQKLKGNPSFKVFEKKVAKKKAAKKVKSGD